ncbi:MAG: ankyrin repeat domain-containing protein [Bdellovibrionales bacterium]|nr:ankyrin repeat domain-containing protein [Bdellovibrionales bacterium]
MYALRRVGATELHLAIATCHTLNLFVSRPDMDDLREIISKGIPVNATDNKGRTALHYAFAGGNNTLCNDYVYQLMELGADPDIKDSTGRNPYQTSNRGYRYLIFQ